MKKNFLENLLFFIIQRIRVLIIFVVCSVILSVFYCTVFVTPRYRATATAVISLSEEYVQNVSQSLVQTQSELTRALVGYMDENYIFKNLSENLPAGLSRTYTQTQLQGMLSATNVKEAFVLKVTASAPTPNDAALLCNAYITQGLDNTLKIIDVGYWEMVESAKPPKSKYYPSEFKAVFYGIIIGTLAFCAVAFVYLFFNNRVNSKKELEEAFPEIPVLAEVAEFMAKENE